MPFAIGEQVQLSIYGINYLSEVFKTVIMPDLVGTIVRTPNDNSHENYYVQFSQLDLNYVDSDILDEHSVDGYTPLWLTEEELSPIHNVVKEKTSGFKEFQHKLGG
jgi:hypothetical protein